MNGNLRRTRAKNMDESILTNRQKQVLRLIRNAIHTKGVPPSRNELARELGVKGGGSSVEVHLYGLQRKGFISLIPNVQRGIKLTQPEPVPVLEMDDEVPEGEALFDEKRIVEYLPWSLAQAWSPEPDYCVRLSETSMRSAGLGKNDVIGLHATREASTGQKIVAQVDGVLTCCQLGDRIERTVTLKPLGTEASTKEAIRVDLTRHKFQIEGVVVGMIVGVDLDEIDVPPAEAPK